MFSGWGGRTHIHTASRIAGAAFEAGFQVEGFEGAFLFSPVLYRYSPKALVALYAALERLVPKHMRNVRMWKLIKR